jgi:predicted Fe-Mo cluster-binding NifX family protein
MSFEAVANTNLSQGSGVGIQSSKVVADKGAKAVLTGNVGPKAYQTLSAGGLEIITGVSGIVREAAQQYKNGRLQATNKPDVQSHSGFQATASQPQGSWPRQASEAGYGIGRGMGGGRGMGMGRGMGGGLCGRRAVAASGGVTRQDELAYLKEHARMLREQMEETQERIKKLENE